ncbi:MAG TPA: ATP-binding protein [Mycobacteriales bacterium]|nr:ATP-binding protein [Mycobacteriales bacterium]
MHVDASVKLPGDLRAPAEARRFVARHLSTWLEREDVESAVLVTSELVTTVSGRADECLLDLHLAGPILRVEVCDHRPGPRETTYAELKSGRSLRLLEVLCRRWGVEDTPGDGTTLWCELRVRPQPADSARGSS